MQRARRILKELEAVFSNTRPYPGIIADPITGEFGTGIPYLEYLQFLTNELNKKETNGRSTPMGHIIANQNPSHLIPPLKVTEKEAELVKLGNLAYTAARQREEESLRKSLRENTEAIATLAAASTAAIALIKETSGADVQSLMLRASIGNDLEPSKTMAIFKLEADRRYATTIATATTTTTTEESAFGAEVTNLVEEPRVSGAQSTSNNCSTTTTTEEEMERAFNDLVDVNTELNSNEAFNLRIRWLIKAKKVEAITLWSINNLAQLNLITITYHQSLTFLHTLFSREHERNTYTTHPCHPAGS